MAMHEILYIKGPPFRASDKQGPLFVDPRSKREAPLYPSKKPVLVDDKHLERCLRHQDFDWWYAKGFFLVDGKPHPKAKTVARPPAIEKPPTAYVVGNPAPVQAVPGEPLPTVEDLVEDGLPLPDAAAKAAEVRALAGGAKAHEAEAVARKAREAALANPPASPADDLATLDADGLKAMHHAKAVKLIGASDDAEVLGRLLSFKDPRESVTKALNDRLDALTAPTT